MSDHHKHDSSSNQIGVVFFLNFGFTIIEFVGGILTNSTAIMADAVHDLGDTLTIGMAWILSCLSQKNPDDKFTYGYHRFSLLGALLNGAVLIAGSIWVLSESLPNLIDPKMPNAIGMLWLALLGVIVNGYAAWKLIKGKTLNEQVLSWHLIEDVLGWVSVLIVSVMLMFFDWPILDPLLSIVFTLFILINVFKNTRQTLKIFLQSSPDNVVLDEVRHKLMSINQVNQIHHLHLWSLDGERHVLTAHLKVNEIMTVEEQKKIKKQVGELLSDFAFVYTTIELEFADEICRDENFSG